MRVLIASVYVYMSLSVCVHDFWFHVYECVFGKNLKTNYHLDAVVNILSQSAEKDNGATITYDDDRDEYTMSFTDDDTYILLTFTRVGGLYCVDTTNMDESYYTMTYKKAQQSEKTNSNIPNAK
jgi:hypothetical protein